MPEKSTSVFDLLYSLFASEKFIAAFIGLIAGTIATFVAPWTKWKFEKEKIQLENRKEKIRRWREEIDNSTDYNLFRPTATFHDLKDRFTKEELVSFGTIWVEVGSNYNEHCNMEKMKLCKFHEVVSIIEEEWGIT